MSVVFVPSPAELGSDLRFIYERINARIELAIAIRNFDMYNDACAEMQKFYRAHFGRDYV